jgi:hypothetical protein
MPATDRATPDDEVVCTDLKNDEGVLLHLGTQTYYSLNRTGLFIWRLMVKGLTLGEIACQVEGRFEVSSADAERSVRELADELATAKLVSLG